MECGCSKGTRKDFRSRKEICAYRVATISCSVPQFAVEEQGQPISKKGTWPKHLHDKWQHSSSKKLN
eukprot:scaffold566_cov364-Pavlova_lutheri.AAC.30